MDNEVTIDVFSQLQRVGYQLITDSNLESEKKESYSLKLIALLNEHRESFKKIDIRQVEELKAPDMYKISTLTNILDSVEFDEVSYAEGVYPIIGTENQLIANTEAFTIVTVKPGQNDYVLALASAAVLGFTESVDPIIDEFENMTFEGTSPSTQLPKESSKPEKGLISSLREIFKRKD